jgi:hypothetical protein
MVTKISTLPLAHVPPDIANITVTVPVRPADQLSLDNDIKVWARSVTAFVPERKGGYSIHGPWLGVRETSAPGTHVGKIGRGSNPIDFVIVCASLGKGTNTFRVIFVLDTTKPATSVGVGTMSSTMSFDHGDFPNGSINVNLTSPHPIVHVDTDNIRLPVSNVTGGLVAPATLDIKSPFELMNRLNVGLLRCNVAPETFIRNAGNCVYQAAALLAYWSKEGKIPVSIPVSKEADLPSAPEQQKLPDVKMENHKKRSGSKKFVYVGKDTKRRKLHLPAGYVYLGKHLGLRMFAEQNHKHPDNGMHIYKMLDGLMDIPEKDMPMWVAVMQEEIEKMEDIIAATRIAIVALTSNKDLSD